MITAVFVPLRELKEYPALSIAPQASSNVILDCGSIQIASLFERLKNL